MRKTNHWTLIAIACAACARSESASNDSQPAHMAPAPEAPMVEELALKNRLGSESAERLASSAAKASSALAYSMEAAAGVGVASGRERGAGPAAELEQPAAVTRSWFPETFLFEPLVVTDEHGEASYSVRVPDRLTSWRVLALAHSRAGAQAGAVTSFLGTLPVYVDPVVPKTLMVGDEVMIPIQLVNTSAEQVTTSLGVEVENATVTLAPGNRTIAAGDTQVEYAKLKVARAGQVLLRVTLGSTDAVLRTIQVKPAGQKVTVDKSGTLAAARTFRLPGNPGADPSTDHVKLRAYPGALAMLRAELTAASERTALADNAYTLLLATRAKELQRKLGGDGLDPEALRETALLATQRVLRQSRTLDVPQAVILAQAGIGQSENAVLQRLGRRAADHLAQSQLPDGTFPGRNGRSVQHMLIETAEALRAVTSFGDSEADRRRATAMSARALGAFTRNLKYVEDGYTAAAILATKAVSGELAAQLRTRVLASITTQDDGSKYLRVGSSVVRPDGAPVSLNEATAMAVLALADDPKAPLGDLGSTLIASYGSQAAWFDGRSNLLAMQALLQLFKDPPASDVRITLLMDGTPVLEGLLERNKLHHVLTLDAPVKGLAEPHEWQIVADPPVPGLGYALTLESWIPWAKSVARQGVELALPETVSTSVGASTPITITASAPSQYGIHIWHALPTGVQADTASLQSLVSSGTLSSYAVMDGSVELVASSRTPGELFSITYRVVPTFAGVLRSEPSRVQAGSHSVQVPPAVWTIRGPQQSKKPARLASAAP